MQSSTIDIPTADGIADAYLARPDEDGERHPGVLFMIDGLGLRARTEEMADRIARQGYVVLAPNAFYRAGRAPVFTVPDLSAEGARAEFFKTLRPLVEQLTPDRVAADGAAYLDELAKLTDGPVVLTGYCMGTRLSMWTAGAHPERVVGVAGFHGGNLVTDAPDSPHLSAGALRAEVYFGHADQDPSNTPEQIAALDAALEQAGVKHRSEVYAGALHGYTMTDSPVYNEAACERHFAALFDLLERTNAV